VTDLKNFYDSYLANFDNFQVLVDTGNETGARDYYYKEIFPIFENIKQKTRSLVEINENKMITLRDESKIIARNATSITLAISGFTILISIIFVLYLINKIVRPVRDLIQKTRNIANRNYDQQINIIGKDEIASLAAEFNIMAYGFKVEAL